MGGGKGKKDVNAKRKTNFLKHGKIRNSTSLTNLKQNQQPFLKNQQASMQNKTITDAKPTVMHWINARWRAKRYMYMYPGENVTWRKRTLRYRERIHARIQTFSQDGRGGWGSGGGP